MRSNLPVLPGFLLTSRAVRPETKRLKIYWRRWVDIIEHFAHRRAACRQVKPREYEALQNELLQECRTLSEGANEVDGVFYRFLGNLVQPWLTLSVLARADPEILADLLARGRQVERQLGAHSRIRSVRQWAPPVLVMSLIIAVGILLIGTGGGWHLVLDRLRGLSDDVWFAVKQSSDVERLFFVAFVLIIVSIFTVSRTSRS